VSSAFFISEAVRPVRGSFRTNALLMLLCLACWRGPIPLIHAHGSERGADARLEQHLLSFHRGHLQQRYFTWHLHWLLPWERFEICDPVQTDSPVHDPLTHDGAMVSSLESVQILSHLAHCGFCATWLDHRAIPDQSVAGLSLHRVKVPMFRSFLESLLLQAPLCAVTGTALC